MKQQEVFKKIGVIIKELNEQYEYLKTVEGPLNELELELFLANSHFLGDHVTILGKLNAQNTEAKKPAEKPFEKAGPASHELTFFEPLVQAPSRFKAPAKLEPVVENTPAPPIEPEQAESGHGFTFVTEDEPEQETIRHELILDEADWEEDEEILDEAGPDASNDEEIEIPPVPEVRPFERETHFAPMNAVEVEGIELKEVPHEPEPIVEREPEPAAVQEEQVEEKAEEVIEPTPEPELKAEEKKPEPVMDVPLVEPAKTVVKEEVLTINERMSAKMGENKGIVEQLHADSISDLKKAINLNDKLLYIKDLFNGYSLAYSEAIEILNRFTGVEEADLFLKKNYAVKNNWEAKPETTEKFYAILKRRYA